jgi:hypothetical protein
MHHFCQNASGHVCPLIINELLQIKGKEKSVKFEMSQQRWKPIWKCKWNSIFELTKESGIGNSYVKYSHGPWNLPMA